MAHTVPASPNLQELTSPPGWPQPSGNQNQEALTALDTYKQKDTSKGMQRVYTFTSGAYL